MSIVSCIVLEYILNSRNLYRYGQLGIGTTSSVDLPEKIKITNVIDIFAGGWNTLFKCTS